MQNTGFPARSPELVHARQWLPHNQSPLKPGISNELPAGRHSTLTVTLVGGGNKGIVCDSNRGVGELPKLVPGFLWISPFADLFCILLL